MSIQELNNDSRISAAENFFNQGREPQEEIDNPLRIIEASYNDSIFFEIEFNRETLYYSINCAMCQDFEQDKTETLEALFKNQGIQRVLDQCDIIEDYAI